MWKSACKRKDSLSKGARICSSHFCSDDFELNFREELLGLKTKRRLKSTAVPTINLLPHGHQPESVQPRLVSGKSRAERYKRKEDGGMIASLILSSATPSSSSSPVLAEQVHDLVSVSIEPFDEPDFNLVRSESDDEPVLVLDSLVVVADHELLPASQPVEGDVTEDGGLEDGGLEDGGLEDGGLEEGDALLLDLDLAHFLGNVARNEDTRDRASSSCHFKIKASEQRTEIVRLRKMIKSLRVRVP
jgi:hypothetical protein